MSTLRRLVVTADPALLVTDAPPAGVPDNAERLTDDGLLGWRFAADEWAAVSYTHLTLPTKRIV